jgi:HK97 gp10 family phage protein
MSNGTISVTGFGELQEDFESLAKSMGNKIVQDAVMAGARVARDKTREKTPVRTGNLKKNITATRLKQSDTPGGATAGVRVKRSSRSRGKKAGAAKANESPFYWKFIEQGTSKMAAAPFIRPAWDSNIAEIEKATTDKLAEGIDNAITR